jgi:NADH-quinone oxidoreductase subunit L
MSALLPLMAFAVIMLLTRKRPQLCAQLSIAAVAISLFCAVILLIRLWPIEAPLQYTGKWLVSGGLVIPFGLLLDPLSLLMLTVVAAICVLVQVYSLGYMAGDPGFARYYGYMSLFAWAMMSLSISPNMLQLYIFWELVGLSSYLLIGFWFEKFSASEAGKKAFVMTRLGDTSFFLGLLLLLVQFGNLNIIELNHPELTKGLSLTWITFSSLLIFGGIVGKSAQFPLLTWLPDAMEGPTPVSALLHSATMVAAGVFLFARLFPFFSLSPVTMGICLFIGTASMLLAATMAMVSRDIKQIWAYSTISQLGFMIMGLAAGGYFAGVWHLTTHAFFKALLFLCAGAFIHRLGTNDIFRIGQQGGRQMKLPMICIMVAAAALCGLPPFSGFSSKEAILEALLTHENPVWLIYGLMGAFLTAYYTFRLLFVILFPLKADPVNHADSAHHNPHGERWMYTPLLVLAAITLLLGFAASGLQQFLLPALPASGVHAPWLAFLALGLVLGGIFLAWLEFGLPGAKQVGFVERYEPLYELFAQRWYLDRCYRYLLDKVVYGLFSAACTRNDQQVIDGSLDALAKGTVRSSRLLSFLHAGHIQYRLLVIFVVMTLLGLYFF